jgi:hypothetical protein
VIDEERDHEVLATARRDVTAAIAELSNSPPPDDAAMAETARLAVRRAFARVVGYKPMTIVHLSRGAPS